MSRFATASIIAALCALGPGPAREFAQAPAGVTIENLGAGVYAAIRTEPLGLAVNGNSLFIVNDSDVVVVDAQFTRAATLENLAALRRITNKPVSHVINTHWHDDHVAGSQVYRDSFPNVRFISHAHTRIDMVEQGRQNRTNQVQFAPPIADRYERLLGLGLGIDSTTVSPAERASVTSALAIFRQYLREHEGHRETLADTVVDRRMTLVRGGRTIELIWFGRANTRGDLITWLPAQRIISTGDIVVAPVPFGFNSYPTDWIGVFDSIAALRPAAIVPGHGGVQRNLDYLRLVQSALKVAREETLAAVQKGMTVEETRRAVTLDNLRARFGPDEKWHNTLFRTFFLGPAVTRLHEEAKSGSLK